VLQSVAVCCSGDIPWLVCGFACVAMCCSVLQCVRLSVSEWTLRHPVTQRYSHPLTLGNTHTPKDTQWLICEQSMTFYCFATLRDSRCNTLQHTATHCSTLQHAATHCNTLQHTATPCNALPHTATHCNALQHTATHCNALQHPTTHCNTLQHTNSHSESFRDTHT